MLSKYKNDYEKIAMGFLSFVPDLKDIDHLKTELKLYTEEAGAELYLYREVPGGDFEGVVGIEVGPEFVMVRHLTLAPALRTTDVQMAVLRELQALYPDSTLMGTLDTAELVSRFKQGE